MNSAKTTKKKLSEYQVEDLKEIFLEVLKKISSKIILLEIGNDFINIGLAKSQKNKLYIKKILRQTLPEEALDKSIPTDPVNFGSFLTDTQFPFRNNIDYYFLGVVGQNTTSFDLSTALLTVAVSHFISVTFSNFLKGP